MSISIQQLTLRSNRHLATALLETRLVAPDSIEKANSILLTNIQAGTIQKASILTALIYELKALEESKLIQYLIDKKKVGLVDLNRIKPVADLIEGIDLQSCWATMSIPFDRIGKNVCMATCYQLSQPAIDFWNEHVDSPLWYTTSVGAMGSCLDGLNKEVEEKKES